MEVKHDAPIEIEITILHLQYQWNASIVNENRRWPTAVEWVYRKVNDRELLTVTSRPGCMNGIKYFGSFIIVDIWSCMSSSFFFNL